MGDLGRLKASWAEPVALRGNAAERSPESVAAVLRHSRILQGYSLSEVANALNIREQHLAALEESRLEDLPPLVYAQGFVNAYAGFLGLDRADLVARFRIEVEGAPVPLPAMPTFNLNTIPDAAERRRPQAAVVVAGVVLVLVCYGLWRALQPDNREQALEVPPLPARFEGIEVMPSPPAAIPPVAAPVADAPAPVVADEVYATPYQETASAAAPVINYNGAGIIVIRARVETWLQLRNAKGERLSSLVLRAGEAYAAPNQQGLSFSTGNLANIEVSVDGTPVALSGPAGRNRNDVDLNPTRLLNGTAVHE